MSHWFHRNPIKATSPVNYDLIGVVNGQDASNIVRDLRSIRVSLLQMFSDPHLDTCSVEDTFHRFLRLMHGFLFSLDGKETDSKLRNLIKFKWTHSVLGLVPVELSDTWFDALNVLTNMALWYTKRAALVAAADQVSDDEAKEVHKNLRKAAGLFVFVRDHKGRLNEQTFPGSDFDAQVLAAYINMCTAEAQEVTVARAVELKHNADLISALANETANLFKQADNALSKLDANVFEKWRKYLQLKTAIYTAYAYAYLGESLLAMDKCGDAIRACREAIAGECWYNVIAYEMVEPLCKEYNKAKGVGCGARPDKHVFFRRLQPIIKRHVDKAERENGFIYHQKIPEELPELPCKATYGLVKPEQFEMPPPHDAWNADTYMQFNISKAPTPDFEKSKKLDKPLPAPNETPVYQSDKDKNNNSGCSIM